MPPTEQRQPGAVARLEAENAALRPESAKLRQRLEELEQQVGLDSSKSSKPPSSDRPRKPPALERTRSLRGKSSGQRVHKGHPLRQSTAVAAARRWRVSARRASGVELHFLRTLSALF